ncbi:DNA-binding response regulator [Alkalilimnicola ehrlichii]|uniref:DNA-binding response regulator n=1 Tax=Alkalilimnicola ehrlichii TaxID=351052 RepID=A0A3E0WTR7_9GAMM|nr:LytTR family DNA-binding domain-containing protein [Alkalilimnicola ehrlichii]RFA27212.1 DNA-binding response regulator [Alkalilimnicola ehrlichii]RFA35385.1 DNA-binding response regulator [Alkalilimnicola ehrlichii]
MKILIVDDEAPARARLRSLIEALGEHDVVADAGNGAEALAAVEQAAPEVVLLDIRMPGMDGLATARQLGRLAEPPAVIFVTAYGDYALDAFDAQAVDYLLKPVRRERLATALGKARRLNRAQLDALGTLDADDARDHILCRRRGRMELIPLEEIRYFQADQKYVTVEHLNGSDLIEDSLRSLEQVFGDKVLRIHRNALVNPHFLTGMEKSGGRYYLLLRGCTDRLEVSRRQVPELRSTLRRMGL